MKPQINAVKSGGTMEELIKKIKFDLGYKINKVTIKNNNRAVLSVDKKDICDVARTLFEGLNMRFMTASATDTPEGIEILYHFALDSEGRVVSVRTLITDKKTPQIESITPVIIAAEWIEREIHDILGVKFLNHPNLKRLLLSDDWPEGDYPLRKENKDVS